VAKIREYHDSFAPAREYLVHVVTDKNPTSKRAEFTTIKTRRPQPECEAILAQGLARTVHSLAFDHFVEGPSSEIVVVTLELAATKPRSKRMTRRWSTNEVLEQEGSFVLELRTLLLGVTNPSCRTLLAGGHSARDIMLTMCLNGSVTTRGRR